VLHGFTPLELLVSFLMEYIENEIIVDYTACVLGKKMLLFFE
jgi:hypothetical protein